MFAVERRREDGRWERAEPLIANPYLGYFDEEYPHLPTLHATYAYDTWTFEPRDQWIIDVDWNQPRPFPEDATQETIEFLTAWTWEENRQMLLLRELEETDWVANWRGHWRWQGREEKGKRYLLRIRWEVLDKLRPLGGPDAARLIYGHHV